MLHVVTWKWGTRFGPEYANRLRYGLDRHLRVPFLFHVITDDAAGLELDNRSVVHPMYTDHAEMRAGKYACFRRLRMFEKGMAEVIGPRILHLDMDCVITGDVTPLFDRPEPLVIFSQGARGNGRVTYNPSMVLMDAGVLDDMWVKFHARPKETHAAAVSQGWSCSDMSIVNDYLHKNRKTVTPATWEENDMVQAYWRGNRAKDWGLRENTRIVLFYGRWNPGDADVTAQSPWVTEHWH